MGEKFEKTDPTTRRLAGADLQKALKNHNVRGDSPVARDLYARAEVVRGYCGELLVRIPDNTRRLLTADAYLTQLEHPEDSVPARSTGPYRIRRKDSELINASLEEIAAGRAVVLDDPA